MKKHCEGIAQIPKNLTENTIPAVGRTWPKKHNTNLYLLRDNWCPMARKNQFSCPCHVSCIEIRGYAGYRHTALYSR